MLFGVIVVVVHSFIGLTVYKVEMAATRRLPVSSPMSSYVYSSQYLTVSFCYSFLEEECLNSGSLSLHAVTCKTIITIKFSFRER